MALLLLPLLLPQRVEVGVKLVMEARTPKTALAEASVEESVAAEVELVSVVVRAALLTEVLLIVAAEVWVTDAPPLPAAILGLALLLLLLVKEENILDS